MSPDYGDAIRGAISQYREVFPEIIAGNRLAAIGIANLRDDLVEAYREFPRNTLKIYLQGLISGLEIAQKTLESRGNVSPGILSRIEDRIDIIEAGLA